MSTFFLEVITPERNFYSGEAECVIFKSIDGEMGVLAKHAPTVTTVNVGPLRIKNAEGKWTEAVVTDGFAKIMPDRVVIMTDTAEYPEEIDINRARAAKQRAEERLQKQLSQLEYMRSKTALARAMARIKATSK
ncbi:ATP synthase F1 subunit epsilon [Ruminiclostridium cellobioparum]|jgi:F-type H+-transporting ATPase subunit epsilon|uniref:ATP synthase epsilon chain n=1 Tax=Ruminiclostridium cellobioparum subsp. termitidis CT1112 TaxID=1195236 RepID=S0FJQ3_RUMCE|nr:ATP synthase F1 subunit epsilon [Ruminiclostridium cellobioparum]EMS72022.1 ATP synthase, F1 epsilon subunit (delta in mitochondria) [Ruminiclostridium cellobioparum subsp. termitidis CT1112]